MNTLCPACGKPLIYEIDRERHRCPTCRRTWTDDALTEAQAPRVPPGTEQAQLFAVPAPAHDDTLPRKRKR